MLNSTQKAQSIVGYYNNRADNDFYPTPPQITRDILKRETLAGNIWGPACGIGSMSSELRDIFLARLWIVPNNPSDETRGYSLTRLGAEVKRGLAGSPTAPEGFKPLKKS